MKSDAIVGSLKEAAKAGIDVDEALDQLSELVELAHAKPVKQNPDIVMSLVPLGPDTDTTVAVGWDTCSRCNLGCSSCSCKGGPVEPEYVKKFRQDRPDFRLPTPVSKVSRKKSASASSEIPVSSDTVDPDNIGPTLPGNEVVGFLCTTCNTRKPFDAVDKNDDDTFTCHDCQSAS